MTDWPSVFDEAHPRPGASADAVAAFLRSVRAPLTDAERAPAVARGQDPAGWALPDRPLPESFASFLQYSDGGHFTTGRRRIRVLGTDEIRREALFYGLPALLPGTLPFGFTECDYGRLNYLFDLREPAVDGEYPVIVALLGNMSPAPGDSPRDATRIADGFPQACRDRYDPAYRLFGGTVPTADEWGTCADPHGMLAHAADHPRALRRFACLCVRRAWGQLPTGGRAPGKPFARALGAAERFADGLATAAELKTAWASARKAAHRSPASFAAEAARDAAHPEWPATAWGPAANAEIVLPGPERDAVRAAQGDILREVIGNPLRPDPLPADWPARHPTVVAIARHVHDDRAYADLPVLADALEEAGCPDESLVAHCRRPGGHHWGCWAVARLLGEK